MTDNQLLIFASVVCLVAIAMVYRKARTAGMIHLSVFVVYSAVLYYNLFFNAQYGSGFLWWFVLLVLTATQISMAAVFLLLRRRRR